jgi:hypothetical protein
MVSTKVVIGRWVLNIPPKIPNSIKMKAIFILNVATHPMTYLFNQHLLNSSKQIKKYL